YLLQLVAVHAVKEGGDVRLQYPLDLAPVDRSVQGTKGVMGLALRPEAVRAVQELLLVDGFQYLAHRVLDDLIFDRRDPNRPRLARFLGDVHTPDRLMPPLLGPQPRVQVRQPEPQVLPIFLLRDSIHTHRRAPAEPVVGPLHARHIDQMCQRMELPRRFLTRSFRYLPEFR